MDTMPRYKILSDNWQKYRFFITSEFLKKHISDKFNLFK